MRPITCDEHDWTVVAIIRIGRNPRRLISDREWIDHIHTHTMVSPVRFDASCAPTVGLANGCRFEHGLVARLQPLALRAGHVATLLLDPSSWGVWGDPVPGGAAVLLPARRAPAALAHTTSHTSLTVRGRHRCGGRHLCGPRDSGACKHLVCAVVQKR